MATRKKKSSKKSSRGRVRTATKKRGATRRSPRARSTARTTRRTPRRSTRTTSRSTKATPSVRLGMITHTELASSDPEATRKWCARVLGWQFGPPMATPGGPYHMWRFENDTGGGIRAHNPPEQPGTIPYCEVRGIRETFDGALAAGAGEMLEPQALPNGMGWIAIVRAPGGVPIGFWSMS